MRMGILLNEEYTAKLIELAEYMGVDSHSFICTSIDVMYKELNKDSQDEQQ